MRILVLGSDGYIGTALYWYLESKGHTVFGIDNGLRQQLVEADGGWSVVPTRTTHDDSFDICIYQKLKAQITLFNPDAVVHLAEIPAAPFSMRDQQSSLFTMTNNMVSTMNLLWAIYETNPNIHTLKLGCYDDETEIFTNNGWKLFKDLTDDDLVATRTKNNRKLGFTKPNTINKYPYKGKLYVQKNKRIDIGITPNHRCFTQKRSNNVYGELRLRTVEELYNKRAVYDTGYEWEGDSPEFLTIEGVKVPIEGWLSFLGWYLSEGWLHLIKRQGYRIEIGQSIKVNPDNCDEIRIALNTVSNCFGAKGCEYMKNDDDLLFYFNNKVLFYYLKQFGKSADRFIPKEVKSLSPKLLAILLDALIKGDGWNRDREGNFGYVTISKQLSDDVQEIAIKCGYSCVISQYKLNNKPAYRLSLCGVPRVHVNHNLKATDYYKNYDGYVYCVNVGGDGIIFVRKNGRPYWSGNTAGVYSDWIYDNMEIPEGSRVTVQYNGKDWEIPTPRYGASYYHISKLNESNTIDYACKTWGLRCTDINQGPVYGNLYSTRFDISETWGTVLNRFVAQALIDLPLTVYGTGEQVRGYINLQNSLEALELFINNPPDSGEYRMVHQVTEEHSVLEIAHMVKAVTGCTIQHVDNPRVEMEKNNFKFERKALSDFGLKTIQMKDSIQPLIETIKPYHKRIVKQPSMMPTTLWRKIECEY